MKILILILTITPTIALSQINLDDWKADIRYTHNSQTNDFSDRESDYLTNKSVSTNLYLDNSLSDSTKIKGTFTLSDVSGDDSRANWNPPKKDFVRNLYITHKTKDGSTIKAGRLSSMVDKSKLVQSLDVNCTSGFNYICDGSDSIYVNTAIKKDSELEFIARKYPSRYSESNTTFRTRLKRSIDGDNYYLGLSKSYFNENRQDGIPSINDNSYESIDFFGEFSVDGSKTDKWGVTLAYFDYKYDENIATLAYNSSTPTEYDMPYSRTDNGTFIQLNRLMFIDDFRITPRISHRISKGKSGAAKITTNNNIVSTSLGNKETTNTVSNQISIDIEYPIQNGRVSLRGFLDKQTERNLSDNSLIWRKAKGVTLSTLYNLDKSNSIRLGYESVNSLNSTTAWSQDTKVTTLEVIHKF